MLLQPLAASQAPAAEAPPARLPALRPVPAPHPRTHHQKSSTVSKVYTARSVWPQVACFCLPLGLSNHSVHLVSSGCFWEKSGSPAGGGGGPGEAPGHAGEAGRPGRRPGARAAADGAPCAATGAGRPRQPPYSAHSPSCCGCCATGSSPAMAAAATAAGVRVLGGRGAGRGRSNVQASNRAMQDAIRRPRAGWHLLCCAGPMQALAFALRVWIATSARGGVTCIAVRAERP